MCEKLCELMKKCNINISPFLFIILTHLSHCLFISVTPQWIYSSPTAISHITFWPETHAGFLFEAGIFKYYFCLLCITSHLSEKCQRGGRYRQKQSSQLVSAEQWTIADSFCMMDAVLRVVWDGFLTARLSGHSSIRTQLSF